MTEKIYLSPGVADAVRDEMRLTRAELRAIRIGHQMNDWDDEVDIDGITDEEDS